MKVQNQNYLILENMVNFVCFRCFLNYYLFFLLNSIIPITCLSQIYDHIIRSMKYMPSTIFALLLALLTAVSSHEISVLTSQLDPAVNSQLSISSTSQADEPFFTTPIFLGIVALLGFNLLVLALVCAVRYCIRFPFRLAIGTQRHQLGQRYPHLQFQTLSHCLTEGERFASVNCYEREDLLCEIPAFIYGRQIEADLSHTDFFTAKQCTRCGGLTRTLEIFKYGRMKDFWERLFMVVVSPCFLAFTIRMLATDNILWRKYFCTECGYEKSIRQ